MSIKHSSKAQIDILVVDDTELNRQLFSAMLKKMGYLVRTAADGFVALNAFEEKRPDLVIMDVSMPGMDGFEVVRKMRASHPHWFPIIFISANTSNEHVVQGLEAGGDDYLFKPIHFEVLKAKVETFKLRLLMLEELQRQRRDLLNYSVRSKEEGAAAYEFMTHFTQLNRINDPQVQFFMKSAEIFSGDLIAFARTPDNRLHLMLADSAGHGLTSALSVIPLTQPFYQMTLKGFEITSIARAINRHVRDYLPLPRYVAALLVSIDAETRTVKVWNGGCPPALLLNEDGATILHQFTSKNLPLGVLSPEEFEANPELYSCETLSTNLLMCSDGALEVIVPPGELINHDELLLRAQQQENLALFDALQSVLESALKGNSPQDDVAMLLVNLPSRKEKNSAPSDFEIRQWNNKLRTEEELATFETEWDFSILLSATQLKRLDAVPFLLGVAQQIEGGKTSGQLFLIMSELFNNALDHGILGLDSSLKNDPDGMEKYYETRTERLADLENGQISIQFSKEKSAHTEQLLIRFKDSGRGFDYQSLKLDETSDSHFRHGRGIFLLSSMCKSLEYRGNGSEVTAILEI